jgi:hypothetical protein
MKEQNILSKALIGHGFNSKFITSIKGDKSLRESVYNRPKVINFVDENIKELSKVFTCLLLETGVHRLSIGFNNGEIKTFSVFDPLNMEIHTAQNMLDKEYLEHNFPKLSLDKKDSFIKRLYKNLLKDEVFEFLPEFWKDDLQGRNNEMSELTNIDTLSNILQTLPKLRDIDGYYLRTASISLFNSSIALSFNCDGTQIMAHSSFSDFIEEYI